MVVDDGARLGHELSEALGARLYGAFLSAGAYREVRTLAGPEAAEARLPAALLELLEGHARVDLFLSAHTTERDPERFGASLAAAQGRLGLVYSTACHGARAEAAAWQALGAESVVAFSGLNNPLVQFPLFLSRWLGGAPLGHAIAAGFAEEEFVASHLLSLPGAPTHADLIEREQDFLAGSCPVLWGNAERTHPTKLPPALSYARARGGPLGLALRALLGTEVRGSALWPLLKGLLLEGLAEGAPQLSPSLAESLRRCCLQARLRVLASALPGEAWLSLRLPASQWRLPHGATLHLASRVELRPGAWDPEAQTFELRLRGLALGWGGLKLPLRGLELSPAAGGVRLRVRSVCGLGPRLFLTR